MTTFKSLDEKKVPSVCISIACMAKIKQYVKQSAVEIGWLGCVKHEVDEDGGEYLTIYDVYAPPQEVSGVTADIDADGVAKYAMQAENPEDINYWGHSHVNMATRPSGTDTATLLEFIEHATGYSIMSIHNKAGAIYCAIHLGNGIIAEDVPMLLDYDESSVVADVTKEIKDNVRRYVSNVRPHTANRYNPNSATSAGKSTDTGSGSNWQSSGDVARKNGNAQCNAMGLRSN